MSQTQHELPDLLHDSLPLLTETVSEPDLPVLSEMVRHQVQHETQQLAAQFQAEARQLLQDEDVNNQLALIERELQACARLIMQEVIDEYMLQIETELHRRLEEHLSMLLRAGRR